MIALSPAPAARAGIDAAIRRATDRVQVRLRPHGSSAAALAASVQRAADGGKRFRPALVVAACDSFGGCGERTPALYEIAAAFELLHTAFVVHDDVIDHDVERRGTLNVSGEFRARGIERGADAAGAALLGDAAAILAGDVLLHEAVRLVSLADVDAATRSALLDLVDEAVLVSSAGEIADVEHSVVAEGRLDADAILLATGNKTAVYSFSAPLVAGAILAGAGEPARQALQRFGDRIGLAYQLVDDLIGAFGPAHVAGRAEGGDLREAKQTPLIALARQSDAWPQVSQALVSAHTGPVAVRAAQRALSASGARSRLEDLVAETLDAASAVVSAALVPDATRELLGGLVDAVRERVP